MKLCLPIVFLGMLAGASSSRAHQSVKKTAYDDCTIFEKSPRKSRFERSWHYLSRDTLRAMADHLFDMPHHPSEERIYNGALKRIDPQKVRCGDIVFVRSDMMGRYFSEVHPHIHAPYILITHHADEAVPGPFIQFLDDPKILAWFSQNPDGTEHPKFFPMPIGLASRFWPHGDVDAIARTRDAFVGAPRTIVAYLNINEATYPPERVPVKRFFLTKPFCVVADHRKPFGDYLIDVAQAQFVLSPRGNGLDCHRTWEALMMGAIPVVRSSYLDPLFDGLPVLIISDWSEVTQQFLELRYQEIMSKAYDFAPLYHEYWQQKIYAVRDAALTSLAQK